MQSAVPELQRCPDGRSRQMLVSLSVWFHCELEWSLAPMLQVQPQGRCALPAGWRLRQLERLPVVGPSLCEVLVPEQQHQLLPDERL